MTEKIIIDVRAREEYVKDHIKGALNIPLHDLEFYHGFLKEKQVSTYCNSGVRAKIAKKWLKNVHIDADILRGDWEKDYPREKRSIASAINYLEIQPGKETEFQKNIKLLCQKTNEVDGFLGSKVFHIAGVSGVGSFLPNDVATSQFKPDRYIIITYWRDIEAHNKAHTLKFFKNIYDKLPRYSSKMPYEEFYDILK